jgi:hypothetical protein
MRGFKRPPTTHYGRPFQLARKNDGYCYNGKSIFNVDLEYAEDFMRIYKNVGFFGMMHLNAYTHDENLNHITWLDDILLEYYKRFYQDKSISSNTILIIYSDHGPRFSKDRKSIKGLLNERNPFFAVYLPELFKQKYPIQTENLKNNINKIITPMDIHRSLINLIELESKHINTEIKLNLKDINKRGISIFDQISSSRTCSDASVESYWCACLKRSELKVDSNLIKIANHFVEFLNKNILKDHLDICHQLELDSVDKVLLIDSYINKAEQRFVENINNLNILQPPKIENDYEKYLFQIKTKPNSAEYEFSITMENSATNQNNEQPLESINIKSNEISRLNKYENDEHCIHDKFPDLRSFCYCK